MAKVATGFFNYDDGPDGKPMLNIALSDSRPPRSLRILESKLLAGIDTGATLCIMDAALVAKYSLVSSGSIRSLPIGAATESRVPTWQMLIIIDGLPVLDLACMAMDLRSGLHVDFLLGMNAIKNFELIVSRPRNRVTLEAI